MKKKKILIFITHSMGEIDVIFPLLSGIKRKKELQIEILFTSIKFIGNLYQAIFTSFAQKN